MSRGASGRVRRKESTWPAADAVEVRRLAEKWAGAVAGTSYVPLRREEVEELLMGLLRRLLAAGQDAPASARTVASAPLPAPQTRAAPLAAYSEPRLDRGGQVTSGRGLY